MRGVHVTLVHRSCRIKRFRQAVTGSFRFLLLAFLFFPLLASCASKDGSQGPSTVIPQITPHSDNPQITINAGQARATIPTTAFGMNTAVWDARLLDPAVPDLLRQAGVTMLRFPGGSTADGYHWKTNSITRNQGYVNPNNTFDAFMGVTQRVGAQAWITVNYGSNEAGTDGGDPAEAAAWVQYANIIKGYGVKYWEIGNEVYGNGTYGSQWEADLHANKGPATYANNVLQFVRAMKAVDPTIKVGISLTTPNPVNGAGQMADWDPTVLSIACSQIDFVDIHWYPRVTPGDSRSLDAQLLSSPNRIPAMIKQPQAEIAQYCGGRSKDVGIFLGEVNTDIAVPQSVSLVNALFLADMYMSWLENGGSNVSWWDLHNGIDTRNNTTATSLYGNLNYGDHGILSNGSCSNKLCEPAPNTPFPPYYGLRMLTHLGKSGDTLVAATSRQELIAVHAVKQANGNLAVLLVNKDRSKSFTPTLALSGYTPASTVTIYSFGMDSTAISSNTASVSGDTFTPMVPPYSLTTIVFTPARS